METASSRRQLKRLTIGLLAGLLALLLAACEADIDTVYNLNDGPVGSRVMTVKVDASAMDYAAGGIEAIDATIAAHKPDGLDYSGSTAHGDGSYTGVFTINFATVEEYRDKVTAILAAGGQDGDVEVDLAMPQGGLVSGAKWHENFDSKDLMAWLAQALVDDGVVDQSRQASIFTLGDNELVYQGESHDVSVWGGLAFDQLDDHGFSSVDMDSTITDDQSFKRTVSYVMTQSRYADDPQPIDDFLAAATPTGATLTDEQSGDDHIWHLAFETNHADQLAIMTNQALASSDAQVSLEVSVSPDNAARFQAQLVDMADCAAVCSPAGYGQIQSIWTLPPSWQVKDIGDGSFVSGVSGQGGQLAINPGSSQTYVFEFGLPVAAVEANTAIAYDHSVSSTIDIHVDPAIDSQADGALETAFTPTPAAGRLERTAYDSEVVYTITISGDDPASYASHLAMIMPASLFELTRDTDATSFTDHYRLTASLPITDLLPGAIDGKASWLIQVPASLSLEVLDGSVSADGSSATVDGFTDGRSVELSAKGMTLVGFILIGVIALLVIAAVLVLIANRRRIGAWANGAAQRSAAKAAQAAQAQQAAQAAQAQQAGQTASMGRGGAMSPGGHAGQAGAFSQGPGFDPQSSMSISPAFDESRLV
ncbi:MAG: hypothetical protein LBV30_08615 [Propionibacteriaceae bacterium]|jgi:hypothetical protein|nr:hypothetical protein [Propionibacteriaceae bacterium]